MGDAATLVNLTDRVKVQASGKLGEDPFRYAADDLLLLLKDWRNSMPDFARYDHGTKGGDDDPEEEKQQQSPLIRLPFEMFMEIIGYLGNYEDVIRVAFTCRDALRALTPVATAARKALETDTTRPYVKWNGSRIVVLPDDFQEEHGTLEQLFAHARSKILVAAKSRGCDENDPAVAESLSLLKQYRKAKYREIASQEITLFKSPEMREDAWFSLVRRRLTTASDLVWHERLQKDAKECAAQHFAQFGREGERDGLLYRYRLGEKLIEAAKKTRSAMEHNHDQIGDKLRIRLDSVPNGPYRIVNLDTLEHLDSLTVSKYRPQDMILPGRAEESDQLDVAYVLYVHLFYFPDYPYQPNCGDYYDGTESFGEGRWAGHRLRHEYVEAGDEAELKTRDVTVEMMRLAVAVWNDEMSL